MSIVLWLGAAATAVTSIGILWNKVIHPVIKWGMRLDKTISFVEAQMVPNGGTSLRDSVNRIEARLTAVEEHLTQAK